MLSFDFDEFGNLRANSLFRSNAGSETDAQCRLALIAGVTEVESSFISIDNLQSGEIAPSSTTFIADGLNLNSFDSVRLSGCLTSNFRPTEPTSEPDFSAIVRVGFEGVRAFVLGSDFDQFGNFQLNSLFQNTSNSIVDAQCRVTLISGLFVIDSSFISVDDIAPGESVPDSTTFLMDGLSMDSFDRIRLSGCFTIQ